LNQNGNWNQSYFNHINPGFQDQNSTPITLTWNVNAYIKTPKSIPTRIKNVFKREEQDDDDYTKFYSNHQIQDDNESEIKHILKNSSK